MLEFANQSTFFCNTYNTSTMTKLFKCVLFQLLNYLIYRGQHAYYNMNFLETNKIDFKNKMQISSIFYTHTYNVHQHLFFSIIV